MADWVVLRTRNNHEKSVEENLQYKGIEAYLPKRTLMRQWKSRRKAVDFPLFPGYVFARPEPTQLYDADRIPGACGMVKFNSKPAFIRGKDIDAMRAVVRSEQPVTVHEGLQVGERVIILDGALKGTEGLLVRFKGEDRFVLNAELLGQSVSIVIESSRVMRI